MEGLITVVSLALALIGVVATVFLSLRTTKQIEHAREEARRSTAESILFGLQSTHRQMKEATKHLQTYLEGEIRSVIPEWKSLMSGDDLGKTVGVSVQLLQVVGGTEKTLDAICKQLETAHKSLEEYIRRYNPNYDIQSSEQK